MGIQSISAAHAQYRRDLGDGLVLRWSTVDDLENINQMYAQVFRDGVEADSMPDTFVQTWVRDLMSGKHPLIAPGDFALVEDTKNGATVAATCLMTQTWEYAGIPFPVGRPEVVASLPDYRNRGLVRAVFDLIHARSAERGDLAQGITGIPYFYRQFGYEYGLDLDGRRSLHFSSIAKLKPNEVEPYMLRQATLADIPHIMALYDRERARGPVSTRINDDYWRWLMEGQNHYAGEGWVMHMIIDAAGNAVGYVWVSRRRWSEAVFVRGLAVDAGTALVSVLPSVLRAVRAMADQFLVTRVDAPPATQIGFNLYADHPVYALLGSAALINRPYAWYVRVPDLPRFIKHIALALEQRLAASSASGYTGDLTLNFYRGGLRLAFEQGRLTIAEDYRAPKWGPGPHANFPPLVFLQLVFGRRSLTELNNIFPDTFANTVASPLLDILFPAQPAWVLPLD